MELTNKTREEFVNQLMETEDVQKAVAEIEKIIVEEAQSKITSGDVTAITIALLAMANMRAKLLIQQLLTANLRAFEEATLVGLDYALIVGLNKGQVVQIIKQKDYLDRLGVIGDEQARILQNQVDLYKANRSQLIANEVGFASMSSAEQAKAIATGFTQKKSIHANDAFVCPICIENANTGWIPIDQEYPSGDATPPYHPNCRCIQEFE